MPLASREIQRRHALLTAEPKGNPLRTSSHGNAPPPPGARHGAEATRNGEDGRIVPAAALR